MAPQLDGFARSPLERCALDPGHRRPDGIDGHGRGFYFEDPSGHNVGLLTRPYGS